MAGRKKKCGIDFSAWDVDVFDDPKVEKLLDSMGAVGFLVYFCVCQKIYATNGYYMPWSKTDAPGIKRAVSGVADSQTVVDVVDKCLDLGLFDMEVYVIHGVLTSRAIQRNFAVVLAKRRRKEVADEYWLLDENDDCGAVRTKLSALQ